MDYLVLSLLHSVMALLAALAPLLVTTALSLILMEAFRANHRDHTASEDTTPDISPSSLVPRP